MHIALLHTAKVHIATFDALFAEREPSATLTHQVAPELLAVAQEKGIASVQTETQAALQHMSGADAVICTCSTLGPLFDGVSESVPHVIRIDRPLMHAACSHGPNILVAICLESTRAATQDLLHQTAAELNAPITPEFLFCHGAWPHFEAGRTQAFAETIATQISDCVASGGIDCVVLAQASMRVAETLLADRGIPVLSSPRLAVNRAIEIAARRRNS